MSKSLDRLTLLATFARIADRGSISQAARDLSMSQASASRHLAELENRLGVLLAQRTTHSFVLTEAGRVCLVDARLMLESWDGLVERHAEPEGELRGKLKVVAPVALGQLHLARAAFAFQRAHPGVTLEWHLQDDHIRFVESGCDLWVTIGRVPDERLIARRLGKVERLIVASPEWVEGREALAPEALAPLPCVALGPFEGDAIGLRSVEGEAFPLSARAVVTTNNIFAAREALLLGVGYGVMPRWFIAEQLDAGTLVDLLPTWRAPTLAIHAAFLPTRRQSRRLRMFMEHMAGAVEEMEGVQV